MANDSRLKALAAGLGVGVAVVAGIWGAYVSSEAAEGRDAEAAVEAEPDEYLGAMVDFGAGPKWVEMKARRSHIKAGKSVEVPGLGHAVVVEDCGNMHERKSKCPAAERCACCCRSPSDEPIGDCVCSDGPGDICRNGYDPQGRACDVDAAECVPWRCWVVFGDDPGQIYEMEKGQVGK